jgi:hypothetical protein
MIWNRRLLRPYDLNWDPLRPYGLEFRPTKTLRMKIRAPKTLWSRIALTLTQTLTLHKGPHSRMLDDQLFIACWTTNSSRMLDDQLLSHAGRPTSLACWTTNFRKLKPNPLFIIIWYSYTCTWMTWYSVYGNVFQSCVYCNNLFILFIYLHYVTHIW